MPLTTRYFISACFVFFVVELASAQKKDVLKKDFTPTGIRLGTDLIDIGKTLSGNTFRGWELNGDIDLSNYYLAVDIGSWAKNVTLNNGNYSNSGAYYRAGIDVNFLGKDPDKNMFFLGFRVGRAVFNESLTYDATSPVFNPVTYRVSNGRVTGGWAEVTTGLRVKVWRGLWMGYTARMKFAPSTKGNSPGFVPYDMPGYGI